MKKLYILRHAKSDYPEGVADHERPINRKGQQSSILIGKYIREQNISPDVILSSDSTRTRETITNIKREAGLKTDIEFTRKLYLATPGEILKQLAKIDDKHESAMVVCHNPGAALLAATLIADGNDEALSRIRMKYPTSGLAILALETTSWENVDPSCGYLEEFITPKILAV